MNVHHLELFYYVAKYEGITAAVRKMPYGIQQPAVSGQILHLEKELGVKLFNRRPFILTSAGEELYDYIYPFFSELPHMSARLRGEESQHLRIAASAAVLNNHLPGLLEELKKEFPQLRLTLRDATPSTVDSLLIAQEVDIAVSVLQKKQGSGIRTIELIQLPMVILVPKKAKVDSCEQLYGKENNVEIPLVCLPKNEALSQNFQRDLERMGMRWEPTVEVNTLDLVESYVEHGFGYGLSVEMPHVKMSSKLKKIPLPKFSSLTIGLIFQGKLKPLARKFAEKATREAKQLVKKQKC